MDTFDIKFRKIINGFLCLDFIINGISYHSEFDEDLADPVPGLIQTSLCVSNHKPLHWFAVEAGCLADIEMKTAPTGDLITQMYISFVTFTTPDIEAEPPKRVEFNLTLDNQQLITAIRTLTNSILTNPGFPFQYPNYFDAENGEEALELTDKIYSLLPEKVRTDDTDDYLEEQIQIACMSAMCKVSQYNISYIEKYTAMLKDYIVPEKWVLHEIPYLDKLATPSV